MKDNEIKNAYLLAREYALELKEPVSTGLMIEAQKNLLSGFIEHLNKSNKVGIIPFGMTAEKIMNFGSVEVKQKFTEISLRHEW